MNNIILEITLPNDVPLMQSIRTIAQAAAQFGGQVKVQNHNAIKLNVNPDFDERQLKARTMPELTIHESTKP